MDFWKGVTVSDDDLSVLTFDKMRLDVQSIILFVITVVPW